MWLKYWKSNKPDKIADEITKANWFAKLVDGPVQLLAVPTQPIRYLDLLQPVHNVSLPHILVISPAVANAKLPIHEIVYGTEPVPQDNGLGPQVILQIVRVVYVLEVQDYATVGFARGWEVVLVQGGVESQRILQGLVSLEGSLCAMAVKLEHQVLIPFIECE